MSCNCKNKDIPSIRSGNDVEIRWALFAEDGASRVPYNIEGKEIVIYFKSKYKRQRVTDVRLSGNVATFTFYGKDQHYQGLYAIELVENEGREGMHTTDVCKAFRLVNCTCDTEIASADGAVQISVLELSSSIQFGTPSSGGGGSIDPELLEACMPLSRDFSDDFNNDFAR